MYIKRDLTPLLNSSTQPIQVLLGPRQCGKSTLFAAADDQFREITFDDLQLRQLANNDPALFFKQFLPPLILDEVQYVPNIFSELKKIIDQIKRKALFEGTMNKPRVLFRLTGSNQLLMDKNVSESLAGRASFYFLNTLTVHEILNAYPQASIKDILFKGGWPELYNLNESSPQSPIAYMNDYIRSYVEKDIIMGAGIQKIGAFQSVLRLLSARTAQETKHSEISNSSGVSSVTVKEWMSLLERADLIFLLKPFYNNLNKRLIKSPKLYFLDTGLASRLQGWSEADPLMYSPQIGALFETLVLAEIVKFMRNYNKDWELFYWRTKDGEEIDFIIKTNHHDIHAFEVKLAVQGVSSPIAYPASFKKQFSPTNPLTIVTFGGEAFSFSDHCQVIPITLLHDFLQKI